MMKRVLLALFSLFLVAGLSPQSGTVSAAAHEDPSGGLKVGPHDIGGKVRVPGGGNPAGLWVIAETDQVLVNNGRPGEYRKIVVTGKQGFFLIPDLPSATYNVWVRGYGLVDSTPVSAQPGQRINLRGVLAPNAQAAAQIYPPNYWFSLFNPPSKSMFPGTGIGPGGNGIPTNFTSQAAWIAQFKLGCELCHQIGDEQTRDLLTPSDWDQAWHLAATMSATADGLGRRVLANHLAEWADGIAAGKLVPPAPPRPSEPIEQNIVITEREWGGIHTYAHDAISTDKRDPLLYPDGKIYGTDLGEDHIVITDPVTNVSTEVKVPTLKGYDTPWCDITFDGISVGFCSWNVYENPANPHSLMLDNTGKLWFTSQIRPEESSSDYPWWCAHSPNGSPAAIIMDNYHHRQLAYLDTNTGKIRLIDTCYGTHHLQFDASGNLWLSGDSYVIGEFEPSRFDPSNPNSAAYAEKWYTLQDEETGQLVPGFIYGITYDPVDDSVWGASPFAYGISNRIIRLNPLTGEMNNYPVPAPGRGPRGIDFTKGLTGRVKAGLAFFNLGGSGQLGMFDRSKCADPASACPEGFTFWDSPGPKILGTGSETGSADFHYLIWVDRHNAVGLGYDMVYLTGTDSDAIDVFDPVTQKFIAVLRVPYPLGWYMRSLDARVDNPSGGWKGRSIWADYGEDPISHTETGMGQTVQIQFRPSNLAD